ncbi:hypothetical protein [Wenzhouxiangella sp. EGI_FJ10409]|uniref:hypothetical protein n=1 Tax=Wenzhouxiangella sp. EGI_FJ10409 TaxID=3243767 RepID=UPI0035E0C30F
MMPSAASRERLAALGIDIWVRRDRRLDESSPSPQPGRSDDREAAGSGTDGLVPRVRMASGDGDWLLVQDAPWDGRYDTLLGDIQAAIGSTRCRFGQWAHSESAGVALDELESRGVQRVLVFGAVPAGARSEGVLAAAELHELARSAGARRHLWRLLAEALES